MKKGKRESKWDPKSPGFSLVVRMDKIVEHMPLGLDPPVPTAEGTNWSWLFPDELGCGLRICKPHSKWQSPLLAAACKMKLLVILGPCKVTASNPYRLQSGTIAKPGCRMEKGKRTEGNSLTEKSICLINSIDHSPCKAQSLMSGIHVNTNKPPALSWHL